MRIGSLWLLCAIATMALSSGCNTARKRAEKFFEAEAYEDAAAAYEEVLRDDPNDADATIALQICRNKIIATKLIEVRLSRMAGNKQNSLDMLHAVVVSENGWKVFPKGQVAFTQEEEATFALTYLTSKVRSSLARNLPMPADMLIKKYRPIFEGNLSVKFGKLAQATQSAGKARCDSFSRMASNETGAYYAYFVRRFCAYWGVPQREVASTDQFRQSELFGKVNVSTHIDGIASEVAATLSESVRESFLASPWHDAKGHKTVAIALSGRFIRKNSVQPINLVHEYTVQIPYVEYVPVTKTRQVPYNSTQYRCDSVFVNGQYTQICGNVPVTEYRTEYYTENEPVTRYRTEPRSQPYEANKHYQLLGLVLTGEVRLGKYVRPIALTEKSEKDGIQHDWNLPAIGLFPSSPNLPDPLEWLKEQSKLVGYRVNVIGDELWDNLYCKPQVKDRSVAAQGERVNRCLKLKLGTPPAFADKWYESVVGLKVSEVKDALSLSDL